MNLKVTLTVYKYCNGNILSIITIKQVEEGSIILMVNIPHPISFSKFKRTKSRIIREINKNHKNIYVPVKSDNSYWWDTRDFDDYSYEINLSDLEKIKLSKEQKNYIRGRVNRTILKDRILNPSKEISQMEYRKRAYYGKCKR